MFGAVFGDKESESLPSLARQAMPERAADIDRLFAEGHPTLSMLDNLQASQSFPCCKTVWALMRSTCGSGAMRSRCSGKDCRNAWGDGRVIASATQ